MNLVDAPPVVGEDDLALPTGVRLAESQATHSPTAHVRARQFCRNHLDADSSSGESDLSQQQLGSSGRHLVLDAFLLYRWSDLPRNPPKQYGDWPDAQCPVHDVR